jgi:nicotinate-nucleotide adenylyltransferase
MRYAILGGSFNPVHIGHLALADSVLSSLDYDRVIFVPAFESPFKLGAAVENPQDRLSMLFASILGDTRLLVDDCEIRRKGVSYTIDTLADIERRYYPEGKLGLVIGDDLAPNFPDWKNVPQILEKADIIIARRILAGTTGNPGDSSAPAFPYPHKTLANDIVNISSAEIRARISQNKNWRYLVPQSVQRIIESKSLYANKSTAFSSPIIYSLEEEVRSLTSLSRFLHSRNVAILSADLCVRFGLDPQKGYLAGIVHDICKSMPDEKQLALAQKDGGLITKPERKKPSLLHGRAGAVLLKQKYDIQDGEILLAVKFHTMGNEDMGPLAKVVFMADKIEPSRQEVKPALRELLQRVLQGSEDISLDKFFSIVLDETVEFLQGKEADISEGTLRLMRAMHEQVRGDSRKEKSG